MSRGSEPILSREQLLAILEKVPAALAVLRGPGLVYEFANDLYRALVPGAREGEPFGVQSEQGRKFRALAQHAFESGEPLTAAEVAVEQLERSSRQGFFDLAVQPTRGSGGAVDGVLILGAEVTRLVEARRLLEAEMARTRAAEQELQATLAARIRAEEERERLQSRVLQAQKLESLGVLAGGVAHDFNNLLTIISGNAALALSRLEAEHAARPLLGDVVSASQRAADLTRQLLAYAGRGRYQIRPVELAAHVRAIAALLETSLPGKVGLQLDLQEGLPTVQGDPAQLHQLLLNLVTNAAEATSGDGGPVVVKLALENVGEKAEGELIGAEPLPPGRYLRLSVVDRGAGMDEQTRARIFDPFFSTRAPGRGLGLAAALGVVRGHHGAIRITTAPGQGTCFDVLLPAAGARAASAVQGGPPRPAQGTVLVIDDERLVRTATCRMLAALGYDVLEAAGGAAGVSLFRGRGGAIDAVVLDLTMPGMSGEETLRELRKVDPEVRVVVFSGYTENEVAGRLGTLPAGILAKPFTAQELAAAVRLATEAAGAE